MVEKSLLLKQLFEVGDFQKLQDKISFATEVAMLTVDFTGNPISCHSGCSEFCKRVREDPYLKEYCQKCDSRGGLEAAKISEPYIYICHMGLVDFAIPVILQDTYIGAVMAGQIRLNHPLNEELERVTDKYNENNLEGALLSFYNALPSMSLERIKALSNMIFYLYNYVIAEASKKIETTSFALKKNIKLEYPLHKNAPTLQKALKYINENYTKTIRLDYLSSLCGISSSYFSKLFKKVVKTGLSSYVNSLRIEYAKSLLATTNDSIIDIALEAGFDDCGYFIKIFKRFVGLTPTLYRESLHLKEST